MSHRKRVLVGLVGLLGLSASCAFEMPESQSAGLSAAEAVLYVDLGGRPESPKVARSLFSNGESTLSNRAPISIYLPRPEDLLFTIEFEDAFDPKSIAKMEAVFLGVLPHRLVVDFQPSQDLNEPTNRMSLRLQGLGAVQVEPHDPGFKIRVVLTLEDKFQVIELVGKAAASAAELQIETKHEWNESELEDFGVKNGRLKIRDGSNQHNGYSLRLITVENPYPEALTMTYALNPHLEMVGHFDVFHSELRNCRVRTDKRRDLKDLEGTNLLVPLNAEFEMLLRRGLFNLVLTEKRQIQIDGGDRVQLLWIHFPKTFDELPVFLRSGEHGPGRRIVSARCGRNRCLERRQECSCSSRFCPSACSQVCTRSVRERIRVDLPTGRRSRSLQVNNGGAMGLVLRRGGFTKATDPFGHRIYPFPQIFEVKKWKARR